MEGEVVGARTRWLDSHYHLFVDYFEGVDCLVVFYDLDLAEGFIFVDFF